VISDSSVDFCSEFYVVEKAIEVVVGIGGENKTIRIEALRSRSGHYSTSAYVEESVRVQPAYSLPGEESAAPARDVTIWVVFNLPWTDRDTADDALQQALGFLSERCDS